VTACAVTDRGVSGAVQEPIVSFSPEFMARLGAAVAPAAKVVETTHRAELELGPPITAGGLVRWLSASAVVKFDPNTEGGCALRGWFHYVGSLLGLCEREPETAQMSAGTDTHGEIEQFLKTGRKSLGPVAMKGRHFIPEPGPGLSVEQPIILGGYGEITGVWLRVAGIPWAGHLDLYNHRGEFIDAEGELRPLPPATLECKDWKTTSDLKWAKNAEQVANAIPMTGYAMAGFAMWPTYERAQLTHVYFPRGTQPEARLATALRERRQVERRWEYVTGVARSIVDVAREVDPAKLDVNTDSCWSYNHACPYLPICPRGRAARSKATLTTALGPRMAALVAGDLRAALGVASSESNAEQEEDIMGLLKQVGNARQPEESVSFADLLDEEEKGRDEANAPQPVQPIEGWSEAWGVILASGMGRPPLAGDAALMHATDSGHKLVEGLTYDGDGKLEKLKPAISDPTKLLELARQIKTKMDVEAARRAAAEVAKKAVAEPKPEPAIQMVAPDAPASRPALAAEPVEGLDNAKARELAAARGSDKTPAEALAKATAAAQPKPEPAPVRSGGPEDAAPKAKGRPKEPKPESKPDDEKGTFSIYVDCTVDGAELRMLDAYVRLASDSLCRAWGCKTVYAADNSTEGGYGKGPHILVATCLDVPPPRGSWFVDSRANPLVEAVAVALREKCVASGGVFVRGIPVVR
jgi:hypothetical protein